MNLEGDGRRRMTPESVLTGTVPMNLKRAQARAIIGSFNTQGISTHSGCGGTLWVVLAYCQQERISYTLQAAPGCGYVVEKVKRS